MSDHTKKNVVLYICPTPDCPSAVVAGAGERLEELWTGPKTEDQSALEAGTHGSRYRHNRAECPLCRIRVPSIQVQRVRTVVPVSVPTKGPPTPPLPPPTGKHHPISVRRPEG